VVYLVFLISYGIYKRKSPYVAQEHLVEPEEGEVVNMVRIIKGRITFFWVLEEEDKERFIRRTILIKEQLSFVSREEGFTVTEEMRILVSAAIAQLTFGWAECLPPNLQQIDLFSESFYSRLVGADVKGLTFKGRTMLSWRYFNEGYQIDNDKVNLGLHELAHTVWDERYNFSSLNEELKKWDDAAEIEYERMRQHKDSGYLRPYAATNEAEFWACCVECFFEDPIGFKGKLPALYYAMADIFNQDMLSRAYRKAYLLSQPSATIG
jgi:Mlc titration factor MtfA (ptsG expression regulator)